MRYRWKGWIIATALVGLSLDRPVVRAQDVASSAEARSKGMRELAGGMVLTVAGSSTKVDRIIEPIYRFDDPARGFPDGTLWAFGSSGRPAALLSLAMQKTPDGGFQWLHEFTSLSAGPLTASDRSGSAFWSWTPKREGVNLRPLPATPTPGNDEPKRLRQMKDAARRFKAFESLDPARDDPSDRFELRLLPQPLHRYSDPASGLVDGAIFLMAYGRNPEIALLIEARREGIADPSWQYGLARISAARLRVSLDDREVADLPKPPYGDPTLPYYLFIRPASALKE